MNACLKTYGILSTAKRKIVEFVIQHFTMMKSKIIKAFWFQYKRARVYHKRMKLFKEENKKFDHFYKQFNECAKNSDKSRDYDECCKAYYTLAMVASRRSTAHFEFLKFHGGCRK